MILYIILQYIIPLIPREVPGFKRGPGRLHTNWKSTVNKDLLRMGITWEEAEVAAQNRSEKRHRSVTQCIHLDAG